MLKSKLRFFILSALVNSLIVLFLFWKSPYFLDVIELKVYDTKMRLKHSSSPYSDIVIVAVDERSINEIGRWPWKRTKIANLITKLASYGSNLIVLDMVFSEPTQRNLDLKLAKAINKSKNVILGYYFLPEATQMPSDEALQSLQENAIKQILFLKNANPSYIPHFNYVELNLPMFQKNALAVGSINVIPDKDGVIRKAYLIFSFKNLFYPSLAFASVICKKKVNPFLEISNYGISNLYIDNEIIPVNESGALWINFYGPPKTFPYFSATDIIHDRVNSKIFKNKIVFVGITEIGLADFRPTPTHPLFPGIEINATIASNILQNHYLIKNNFTESVDIAFIFLFPILLGISLSYTQKTWQGILILILVSLIHILLNYFFFSKCQLILNFTYPMLALVFTSIFVETYRNIIIERKSKYLKKAFSSYVSPEVVEQIITHPEQLRLGGEKREITVLFSDIRNFTTISEDFPPEKLVTFLNEYLGPMTKCIMKQKGTLDKFIGDAIMAIFNAPVTLSDHADRACFTALEMLDTLDRLNKYWQSKNFPILNIGIGINTGVAVIGNMGAEVRFNYTAIGDTVNLACRLEGLNKIYGTNIIISEFTAKAIKSEFLLRELDRVKVVGKKKYITIFELMGYKFDNKKVKLKQKFEEALYLYRNRNFMKALELLQDLQKTFPYDGPINVYIERCKKFLKTPPPLDWDGIFIAETK